MNPIPLIGQTNEATRWTLQPLDPRKPVPDFPDEIWMIIISNIPKDNYLVLRTMCKKIHRIFNTESLQLRCVLDFFLKCSIPPTDIREGAALSRVLVSKCFDRDNHDRRIHYLHSLESLKEIYLRNGKGSLTTVEVFDEIAKHDPTFHLHIQAALKDVKDAVEAEEKRAPTRNFGECDDIIKSKFANRLAILKRDPTYLEQMHNFIALCYNPHHKIYAWLKILKFQPALLLDCKLLSEEKNRTVFFHNSFCDELKFDPHFASMIKGFSLDEGSPQSQALQGMKKTATDFIRNKGLIGPSEWSNLKNEFSNKLKFSLAMAAIDESILKLVIDEVRSLPDDQAKNKSSILQRLVEFGASIPEDLKPLMAERPHRSGGKPQPAPAQATPPEDLKGRFLQCPSKLIKIELANKIIRGIIDQYLDR